MCPEQTFHIGSKHLRFFETQTELEILPNFTAKFGKFFKNEKSLKYIKILNFISF